jgi:hypothetical protein
VERPRPQDDRARRGDPAGNYDFHPVDGVRTVAEFVRHLVFWNRWVAEAARGGSPDGAANEILVREAPNRKQLVAALAKSFVDAATPLAGRRGEPDAATVETYASFLGHTAEHYGQLVVYARLNGLVPPASRG